MKKFFLFACVAAALVSCSSDEFLGENQEMTQDPGKAIVFKSQANKISRGTAADATKLGNKFYVYGTKHTAAETGEATNDALVFENYAVDWVDAANSTMTNTGGWEYVGKSVTAGQIAPAIHTSQDVHFWDFSAAQGYTFYAISSQESAANAVITKTTAGTTVYDKGYTVALAAGADLTKLYFADRVVIGQTGNIGVHGDDQKFGGEVNFKFRNAATKVRVGMYETIPGYKVTLDKFYYVDNATPTFATMTTAGTDKFYANVPNVSSGKAGTLTVTYYDATDTKIENQPKLSFDATSANYIALGDGLKAGTELATTSSAPTYDKADGEYTVVFPQIANDKTMKLKVDYTLTSTDGNGEVIKVTGATAEVPATYLQWKPNYAYTYIFKISPNGNGHTGPDTTPAGLYPITFDAAVAETVDGSAEYITTVSEPSLTTFGVSGGLYTAAQGDYKAGSDVYVTVVESSAVVDPAGKYAVYKIADAKASLANEAQVAEWIANALGDTYYTSYTTNVSVVSSVPTEDGATATVNAVKLQSLAAGTYAFEYTAANAWTGTYTKVYKVIIVK